MAVAVAGLDNVYVPTPPAPVPNAVIVVSDAIPGPVTILPTAIAPVARWVTVRVVEVAVVEHITTAILLSPVIVF